MVRLDKKSFDDDGEKRDAYVEEEYEMENNMFRVRNLLKATITVPKAEEMMDVYSLLNKNEMFEIIHINNMYQKGVATKNLQEIIVSFIYQKKIVGQIQIRCT